MFKNFNALNAVCIKSDHKEFDSRSVGWTELAHDRIHEQDFVLTHFCLVIHWHENILCHV